MWGCALEWGGKIPLHNMYFSLWVSVGKHRPRISPSLFVEGADTCLLSAGRLLILKHLSASTAWCWPENPFPLHSEENWSSRRGDEPAPTPLAHRHGSACSTGWPGWLVSSSPPPPQAALTPGRAPALWVGWAAGRALASVCTSFHPTRVQYRTNALFVLHIPKIFFKSLNFWYMHLPPQPYANTVPTSKRQNSPWARFFDPLLGWKPTRADVLCERCHA